MPGDAASITVSAGNVGGIGAVSGFSQVIIEVLDPAATTSVRFNLLPPFDQLGQGDGSEGALLFGLSGGQAVFPPIIPISFSLDLFSLDLLNVVGEPREITIRVSGRGGHFIDSTGESLVPFETIPTADYVVVFVPTPGAAALLPLAGLSISRRRR